MRVLRAKTKRPLDVLAIGAGGHVAAASSAFGVRGDVDVWEITTGLIWYTDVTDEGPVRSLAFHPDGKRLFIGADGLLSVADVAVRSGVFGEEFGPGYLAAALSPDGRRLFLTSTAMPSGTVECRPIVKHKQWPIGDEPLWTDGPHEHLLFGHPAISPDGTRVAVAMHDGFRDRVRNVVQLRDATTGKILRTIDFDPTGADPIQEIAFSTDGAKVLVRAAGRVVKLFDTATGQSAGELLHPGRPYVTGMAVHPNGQVACSRNNGTVCFWNLETRELVRTLDWKLGKLVSAAFAVDGSIGAAGTEDGQVVVWDVDS